MIVPKELLTRLMVRVCPSMELADTRLTPADQLRRRANEMEQEERDIAELKALMG